MDCYAADPPDTGCTLMIERNRLSCDVVVVGGGLSGVCAALAAARHGARTILVHDRPVLGGNSSSEIGVHVCGADSAGARPHARESGIVEELRLEEAVRNPQRCPSMWDLILWERVCAEPLITLLLNTTCTGVQMASPTRIAAVGASRESTEDRFEITGRMFVDCTGDARLGAEAGADYRYGREGPQEHGEPHAQGPDGRTMGASLMWQARDMGRPMPFAPPPWARVFATCDDLPYREHLDLEWGHWWIEYGGEGDVIKDNEEVRDELLACLMGVWDHVKNRCPQVDATNWALTWFGFVPGKRESRRLLGDHILTENDLMAGAHFEDAVCHGGWSIDTHPPGGIHSPEPPCSFLHLPDLYSIPLRALYSRNIENLFMAGRNASCTHMAMASTRVAATGAVMGQAVGTAAALCIARDCLPRTVAQEHIRELQETLLRDDCYIPDRPADDPLDLLRGARVSASSAAPDSPPDSVLNGVTRHRGGQTNQWASDLDQPLPQWLQVDLPRPRRVSELHITFDTGFVRPLTLTLSDRFNARMIRGPQPETVSDYVVEALVGDEWRVVVQERGNYQRKRVHSVGEMVRALRLRVQATHGDPQARVYELRAY